MKIVVNPSEFEQELLLKRPRLRSSELNQTIEAIYSNIAENGDLAVRYYSEQFDKVSLNDIQTSQEEIKRASSLLSPELKKAIQNAYRNIHKFHASQLLESKKIETTAGVICWQKSVPIESVGLYIPGGSAPLFSTVLMLGVPAQIAGCKELVLCTPPLKNGKVHPAVLFSAQMCGIDRIYKVGGSQAIAAMAIGTESIPKVCKIFGPGNQYVTAAKRKALEKGIAIDLPAGPSEVLVYADETGVPRFIASDLLAQAEHGADSQVVFVTKSQRMVDKVINQIEVQAEKLPRKKIVDKCLENSAVVLFDDETGAFSFINEYAPEHLIIASDNPEQYLSVIQNAGSVFLGNYTPESAGDYASGTNHTLPTSGYAKSYSGTNLDAFVKKITFQEISREGLQNLGPTIMTMAKEEQLEAHSRSVEIRLET